MWEFFLALFGGAQLAGRISSDKKAMKKVQETHKHKMAVLDSFRTAVTKESKVKEVSDLMWDESKISAVQAELGKIFVNIPELRGAEKFWLSSNKKPPASNWKFVELLLCINRGCVPYHSQIFFSVVPYYIGNDSRGVPQYIRLSDTGMIAFSRWASQRLEDFGIVIGMDIGSDVCSRTVTWKPVE